MSVIALPQILTERLTDKGADALAEIISKTTAESEKIVLQIAEKRFETELAMLEGRMEKRFAELDAKIERVQADLIKWMFIFWVGQVATITSILFVFFKR